MMPLCSALGNKCAVLAPRRGKRADKVGPMHDMRADCHYTLIRTQGFYGVGHPA